MSTRVGAKHPSSPQWWLRTGDRRRCPGRSGMTLLELVIAIALLALLTAVAAQSPLAGPSRQASMQVSIDSLRRHAMREGRTEHAMLRDSARSIDVTVLPTGLIVADSIFGSGRPTIEVR